MDEAVRTELSKRPRGMLSIGWSIIAVIVVIGLASQFVIMRRAMNLDTERQVLDQRQVQANRLLNDTKQATEEAINILAQYQPDVDALTQDRQKLMGDVTSLENRLSNLQVKMADQATGLSKAQSEEEQAKNKQVELVKSVSELSGQKNAIEEQLIVLNQELSKKRKLLTDLTVESNTLQQQTLALAQVEAELKSGSQKLQQEKADLARLSGEVSDLQSQYIDLSSERTDITEKVSDAENKLGLIQAEYNLLTAQVAQMQSTQVELQSVQEDLVSSSEKLTKIENDSRSLLRQHGSSKTLSDLISSQREELAALVELISAKEDEYDRLKNQAADLTKAKGNLRATESAVESAEARLEELSRQLSARRKELAMLDERISITQTLLKQSAKAVSEQ